MGRVTGRQRRSITRPHPILMPWEVRYQHRIDKFFKAPPDTSDTFQDAVNSTLYCRSGDETGSPKDNETVAMNSLLINETKCSKTCNGQEVMEERRDQHSEKYERETYGSIIFNDDGKVEPPNITEVSVHSTELLNSPGNEREQKGVGSGEPKLALSPPTLLQPSPVQAEVAFSPCVKQRNVLRKAIKYSIHYNLDDYFHYAFTPGKVSFKQRLMRE